VSDAGRVRSLYRGHSRILSAKPRGRTREHLGLDFWRGNKPNYVWVHRLVLEAFVGPCPPGMEGCHNNGIGTDNRLANLRWDTRKNNAADKVAHGTHNRGERHYRAKLTRRDAEAIRTHRGFVSCRSLGETFGVSPSTVNLIQLGVNWAWA
jgi:hypothetical protein